MNLDPQTAAKVRQLAEAKTRAIDREDYLTAKQIKIVEQELKALGSKLAQLDMAKSEAVAVEDYDLAKEIKDECDEVRAQIEEKVSIPPSLPSNMLFFSSPERCSRRSWRFEFLGWTTRSVKSLNKRLRSDEGMSRRGRR